MRCLALADGFSSAGCSVAFVCRQLPGNLSERVEKAGYSLVQLPAPAGPRFETDGPAHSAWLGVGWEQDAAETRQVLARLAADVLVVDHYALDWRWETEVANPGLRVVVLDDLADRRHECDFLVDTNYSGKTDRYAGLLPARVEQLLGTRYALLRAEFQRLRKSTLTGVHSGPIRKITVFFGAADTTGSIIKVADALKDLPECRVHLVCSQEDPAYGELSSYLVKYPHLIHVPPSDGFGTLMASSDLFIGAGGTTTWERCCLGVPSITIATASNQVPASEELGRDGYCLYLGEARSVSSGQIRAAVLTCATARGLSGILGHRSAELVDGGGVRRVVARVMGPSLVLRPARADELRQVYLWRNDPETRKWFFDPGPIDFEVHSRWYRTVVESKSSDLLIAEREGQAVGVIRFDHDGEDSRVSVYLVPGLHSRGLGTDLIRAGVSWVEKNRPGILRLRAEVLTGNQASVRAFSAAGFTVDQMVLGRKLKHESVEGCS